MSIIDAICILVILFFGALGFKRGVIKSTVQVVGTIVVLILAFTFKDILANFLMKFLPFFNYGGIYNGITTINILIYELISFILIFVLLYCILSILVSVSGLIEKLLKMTIILAIPSKILGAIVGLIEGVIVSFLVAFVILHIAPMLNDTVDSKVAIVILERTPFVGSIAAKTTLSMEEINTIATDAKDEEDKDEANIKVLQILMHNNVISSEDAQQLIDDGKITFKSRVSF